MKRIESIIWGISLLAVILAAVACSKGDSNGSMDSGSGQGGSMARFTIAGDYLYTVDQSTLRTFRLTDPAKPEYLDGKDQQVGFDIETIFYRNNLLFMGARSGMYIYNVERREYPQQLSQTFHITSCDPVVADDRYAYVTLNSSSVSCFRGINALQIYDISNPRAPVQVGNNFQLNSPYGLGIDGEYLFICDRTLKVYDVSDPENPIWVGDTTNLPEAKGANAYDVIPMEGTLLMIGSDGLYQFDYSNYTGGIDEEVFQFLSKIEVKKGGGQ